MKLQQLFFLQRMLPDRLSGSTRATPSPCRPRGMNEVLHDGVYTPHHRLFFGAHQPIRVCRPEALPPIPTGRSTGNPLSLAVPVWQCCPLRLASSGFQFVRSSPLPRVFVFLVPFL